MPSPPRLPMRWPTSVALFAGFFYYITFVQFGLLRLARLRLDLGPEEMPLAMGMLTVCGIAATLATGYWIEGRGAALANRLGLIAVCSGAQAGLALLALGLSSLADVVTLCLVLGLALGANSVATLSLVFDGIPSDGRWLRCGAIVAAIYLVSNIPQLVFDRPERIIAFNALLMTATAYIAWRARERGREISPPRVDVAPRLSLALWLPFLTVVVLLDSYTFQRLLTTQALWTLSWGSSGHIWVNGFVHAVGAIGVACLVEARRAGAQWAGSIAALSLILTELLLVLNRADLGGGYVLTAVYNVGVSAYFVLLLALWPACLGPRPDRRLGWSLALTCWLAAPLGIGLAMRPPTEGLVAHGPPLVASVAALLWLQFPLRRTPQPAVR